MDKQILDQVPVEEEFPINPKWKRFEAEAIDRIAAWKANPRIGFYRFIMEFATDIYERGDGLVFLNYREATGKIKLKKHYVKWMKYLSGNEEQDKPAGQ